MPKTLNIEYVKYFVEVESGSNCKLLTETYISSRSVLNMICACGESFKVSFNNFKSKNKRSCNTCSYSDLGENKRKRHTEFINNVFNLVGNEYSVISKYIGEKKEIVLRHENCNELFTTTPGQFLRKNHRCQCAKNKNYKWNIVNIKEFVKQNSKSILISNEYENPDAVIEFKCECNEKFQTTWARFLFRNKRQCNKCGRRKGIDYDVVKKEIEKDGCKLLIDKDDYIGTMQLISIECSCGNKFSTSFNKFKRKIYPKNRCDLCSKNSRGEVQLHTVLTNYNIDFDTEYKFKNLKGKNNIGLRFDFALFLQSEIMLMEFDGEQHFKVIETWGGIKEFRRIQERDVSKNQFCITNNIPLIRIPYWEFDNIKNILLHVLGYFNLIDNKGVDKDFVYKFLVNNHDWSHKKYISSQAN